MKFGLRLPTYILGEDTPTLDTLVAYAQKAEALGFDSLWVVDHYLVANPSYRVSFLDPMIVLSALATATRKVRLGPSVLQLPLRSPVLLAKEIVTLDWLSNGRFDFGIGAGWQDKEFQGVGVPIGERGKRIDEYIEVMTRLWTEEDVSFHGQFVNFDGLTLLPKPVQKPYPPLSFGGGTSVKPVYADDLGYKHRPPAMERVFRRIGRWGRAWHAASVSEPSLIERDWERICEYAREYGRDPSEIERMQTTYMIISEDIEEVRRLYGRVVGKDFDAFLTQSSYLFGSAEKIVAELAKREAMGIDRMIVTPVRMNVDELDQWAEELLKPFLRQVMRNA